jgi:hypothetical protein
MRTLLLVALSALMFLAAAKTHGRQLRLERERHGYFQIRFGGVNPPFVEALWRSERIRFGLATAILTLGLLLALFFSGALHGLGTVALSGFLWAPSLAFLFCSALSAVRLLSPGREAAGLDFGGIGWWTATLGLAAGTALAALV